MIEIHVSINGDDNNEGSIEAPFRTISAAAEMAQPGDIITVHEGVYRERVNPPRGGTSDGCRITYQVAPGDEVWIKGSEVAKGWEMIGGGVWKLTLREDFFGDYHPFKDVIAGDWFRDKGRIHHTGEVFIDGKAMHERASREDVLNPELYPNAFGPEGQSIYVWCCESTGQETTIYANFQGKDPNLSLVEVSTRPTCFYPDTPGRNFITVRGFNMAQAATQWAAPTAEQIGLIGPHWSKGWIIEDNHIQDSRCVGISLGKDRGDGHNVWNNNRGADALGADVYNQFVQASLKRGWSSDTVGHHIVRNNVISDCEAGGIVGGQGAIFSEISNNHIYNIHVRREFSGEEMAGIKLHAPIDVIISDNTIHHVGSYGIWLDWMTQGALVSRNLVFETQTDVFVEVNHGPYLLDHNCLLSEISLRVQSEGGAYVHNLIAGEIEVVIDDRETPYHPAHSTEIIDITKVGVGDDRHYNNIYLHKNALADYASMPNPIFTAGNVELESSCCKIRKQERGYVIELELANAAGMLTDRVTTEVLGTTKLTRQPYVNPDDSPIRFDRDYFGKMRDSPQSIAGPFESVAETVVLECEVDSKNLSYGIRSRKS